MHLTQAALEQLRNQAHAMPDVLACLKDARRQSISRVMTMPKDVEYTKLRLEGEYQILDFLIVAMETP